MRRNSAQLSAHLKAWLYSTTAILFATGALWAWLHYGLTSRSSTEPWLMKIHGAAAMAILVVIGTLLPGHVRFAWHAHRNRRVGLALIAFLALLIASGYGLYYFGDEQLRAWTSWLHLAAGLLLPAIIVFHIWSGRRSRSRKKIAAPESISA